MHHVSLVEVSRPSKQSSTSSSKGPQTGNASQCSRLPTRHKRSMMTRTHSSESVHQLRGVALGLLGRGLTRCVFTVRLYCTCGWWLHHNTTKKYINSKQDPIPWGQHQWRDLAVDSLHWWVLGRVGIVAGVFTLWKVKQPSACWHHLEGPSISFSYRNMVARQLINMCGPLRQVLWKNINVVNIIALISKTIMIFILLTILLFFF